MATTATDRGLLIGGEWAETGEWIEVRSPYDGALVGRVAKGGATETRRALDAAEQALGDPLPAHERAAILDRVAELLEARAENAAHIISAEAGKPLKAARVEASRAVSTFTMAAVEARKLAGEMVPMDAAQAGEGKLAFTLREPIGIVGAISPFNFPLNLVAHKIAPALAAGCTVVLKPAEWSPLSCSLLCDLVSEAGFPPGVFNVVQGIGEEVGAALARHPGVRRISFTGSPETAVHIGTAAARNIVPFTGELGGKGPLLVFGDADLEAAARKAAGPVSTLSQPGGRPASCSSSASSSAESGV